MIYLIYLFYLIDLIDWVELIEPFSKADRMIDNLAIRASGLHKHFGEIKALDGVDLAVSEGEIFGLVGPDGAGKTTTMRVLTGILDATAGAAEVMGIDVLRFPETVKTHIGYMPQRFSLYGDLTVEENIFFFANLYHVPRAERIKREQELLEFSRLTPFRTRLAQDLSGGMKQKLALTCTLIHTPKVLFLDEPTTGVDPVSRRDFWKILYALLKQGVTLFVSTPYMDEAERCNRVALMDKGKVILCDTPLGLKGRMRGDLFEIIAQPASAVKAGLAGCDFVLGVQIFGDRQHVWVRDAATDETRVQEALAAKEITVSSLRRIVPGLEDVFMSLVEEGGKHDFSG